MLSGGREVKRIICFLFVICALFLISACSGEPVPFSDKLGDDRECYIDVVEITPESSINDVVFLYCQCTLADGSTFWMEIFPADYVKYFDDKASEEDISYTARQIVYSSPVRINGKVNKIKNVFEDGAGGKINVFRFVTADETATLNAREKYFIAAEFDDSTKTNTVVYTDLVRIEPAFGVARGISSSVYGVTHFDDAVCECTTASGETVWLYISIDDYHTYFDPTAHFGTNPVDDPPYTPTLELVTPVRIYGITVLSTDKLSTMDPVSAVASLLFEFRETDITQIEAVKVSD